MNTLQHFSSVLVFVNCTICIPASNWSDRQEIGFLPEASKKRMLIAASSCQDTCRHVGRGTLSWYANTWLCQEKKYDCMNETSHLLGLAELWHSPWLVTTYLMFNILFPETQVRDHLDAFSGNCDLKIGPGSRLWVFSWGATMQNLYSSSLAKVGITSHLIQKTIHSSPPFYLPMLTYKLYPPSEKMVIFKEQEQHRNNACV